MHSELNNQVPGSDQPASTERVSAEVGVISTEIAPVTYPDSTLAVAQSTQMRPPNPLLFEPVLAAIQEVRTKFAHVRPHRAILRVPTRQYRLIPVVLLPILFCGALILGEHQLMMVWRSAILFWLSWADIPLTADIRLTEIGSLGFRWLSINLNSHMPSFVVWSVTAIVTAIAFFLSYSLKDEKLPLKYLLRIVCFIQILALLYFWFAPSRFPYNMTDHMYDVVRTGYMLMLAIPIMLAVGYYVLNLSIWAKIVQTGLILGYFVVMIPIKVALYSLILHHFSLLFMPLLYICFGATLDILIFIALYSWVASDAPADAIV